MNPEAVLLSILPVVERISAAVARRNCLPPEDDADFTSWVKTRLLEDDYAIIRKFQGRSSINTYLTVVVTNLMRDFRVHRWGRWRSSMEAKRLGPLATRLEMLLYRDRLPLNQAIQRLRSLEAIDSTDRELAVLAARLPVRCRPREVNEQHLSEAVSGARADSALLLAEYEEESKATRTALEYALSSLPPEDQLILRLRYWEGFSIADVARTMGLPQKPLYRRIERQLSQLRERMEASGFRQEDVVGLLTEPADR